uniref:Uncharacterized protein n=1 Tax=Arion vulgaris TaxID=1028688 RepID=A0A0B6ZLQ0_9EUPU
MKIKSRRKEVTTDHENGFKQQRVYHAFSTFMQQAHTSGTRNQATCLFHFI